MLKTQEYLRNPKHSLELLEKTHDIRIREHDSLPLVILNYGIDSRKTNPIAMECRGLVLEKDTWNIVAKGFNRFFNWGEVQTERSKFKWNDCIVQSKEDGSLGLLYFYDGQWRFNTRGSFGQEYLPYGGMTWTELFCQAIGIDALQDLKNKQHLKINYTYVFELVSPYNQVVRQYPQPSVYLLSIFDGLRELTDTQYYGESLRLRSFSKLNMQLPNMWQFDKIEQVQNHVLEMSKKDKTFEGVVIRDIHNRRWKIKSAEYVSLHRLKGNGDNLFNPKFHIKFILSGEIDEVIGYFPLIEDSIKETKSVMDHELQALEKIWESSYGIQDQKEFAMTVLPQTKFASILFKIRKKYGEIQTVEYVKDEWGNSENIIYKTLFK